MWAPASPYHLPYQGCLDPSDLSDSDDIKDAIDTRLLSLSNPQLGMGIGVEGMVAPGLFDVNCSPSPLADGRVIADGPN